ncbi:MAG: AAA family ATPase [Candidatus Omnitrophica bacterium]|nr:AAA family ATPase [Candidatus Omnitrophota bacterium]
MIPRILQLTQYKSSIFLFGPRQVGKTYLIKHTLPSDLFIDLLDHNEFLRYAKDVSVLSKEVRAINKDERRVVIDEIQRCPELLNEVQLIMGSSQKTQFILTGSSARKLKRAGTNLLGGRAITLHLHPFTREELGEKFILEEAIQLGAIPGIVLAKDRQEKIRLLKSYVETYLKEEIQQESLTRNIPAFARFLELAAHENGNILNFQNIAREVGIHSKTIKEYFSILQDTLLGFLLYPYVKSSRTKIVSHPKFYFFDRGVACALRGELSRELIPGTDPYGRAFEHWVILEAARLLDYYEKEAKMSFFKTTDGAEVDLILESGNKVWAVEIKSSNQPRLSDVRGMRSFMKDHKYDRALCVCQTPRLFVAENIEFLPWGDFLQQLKSI